LLTGFSYMYSSSASPELVTSIKYAIDWNYIYVLVSIVLAGLVGYLCSAKKLRNMSITTS
jgi:cell division protein FtsW (lipid II flippase)